MFGQDKFKHEVKHKVEDYDYNNYLKIVMLTKYYEEEESDSNQATHNIFTLLCDPIYYLYFESIMSQSLPHVAAGM